MRATDEESRGGTESKAVDAQDKGEGPIAAILSCSATVAGAAAYYRGLVHSLSPSHLDLSRPPLDGRVRKMSRCTLTAPACRVWRDLHQVHVCNGSPPELAAPC